MTFTAAAISATGNMAKQDTVATILAQHLRDKWWQQFPKVDFILHQDPPIMVAENWEGDWMEIAFREGYCLVYDATKIDYSHKIHYSDADLEQKLCQLIIDKVAK